MTIRGISARPELNGQIARVVKIPELGAGGRYTVKLQDGSKVKPKPENLIPPELFFAIRNGDLSRCLEVLDNARASARAMVNSTITVGKDEIDSVSAGRVSPLMLAIALRRDHACLRLLLEQGELDTPTQ